MSTLLAELTNTRRTRPRSRQIAVLVADHHAAIRASVRTLCELGAPDVVVHETSDVRSTILFAVQQQPDLLLIDMELPRHGGAQTIRLIKERSPGTRIIAWALDPLYEEEALSAGADLFLVKGTPAHKLCDSFARLADGPTTNDAQGAPADHRSRSAPSTQHPAPNR